MVAHPETFGRIPVRPQTRHRITVGWGTGIVKVFQVQFANDGSIFVHFPYHPDLEGIAARLEALPGKTQYDLTESGAITSHKVKYSHHPDGTCLFSQDRRVRSVIRSAGPRLDADPGHIFTVDVQGLAKFKEFPTDDYLGAGHGGHFDVQRGDPPGSAHFVARWSELKTGVDPRSLRNPIAARMPNGQIHPCLALVPPERFPIRNHVLLLEMYLNRPLDPAVDFLLLFQGGFGEGLHDPTAESSFLILKYPAGTDEDIRSMDFTPEPDLET